VLAAREQGMQFDDDGFREEADRSVRDVVLKQSQVGLDVVNDGEQSKFSYSTYARARLSGLEVIDVPSRPRQAIGGEAEDFPEYFARRHYGSHVPSRELGCVGPIAYTGQAALADDISRLQGALAGITASEAFMTAISPGMMKSLPDHYYGKPEEYHHAICDALKTEYEAVVAAGLLLQIDCPDLGIFTRVRGGITLEEYRREVAYNIELLNYATRDIPPDRMRFHVCWGADEAPHHRDEELANVVDLLLKGRPAGMTIVAANGRHEHEWRVWEDLEVPDDKVIIPGVIDSTTNIIEHPDLVAERIIRFAKVLGREKVIAGVDCGFSTFATDQSDRVDPRIAWAKLSSLAEGARRASAALWGHP
jgi:5-methyltetrahydropteroyltriglutamate--homocysteine methyltransferase